MLGIWRSGVGVVVNKTATAGGVSDGLGLAALGVGAATRAKIRNKCRAGHQPIVTDRRRSTKN